MHPADAVAARQQFQSQRFERADMAGERRGEDCEMEHEWRPAWGLGKGRCTARGGCRLRRGESPGKGQFMTSSGRAKAR